MKELHIITVGTSILSNFGRIKNIKLPPFSDENFWSQKLEDKTFHEELLKFLEENPKRYSAELNSLLSFLEKRKIEDFGNVYFYLIGTATSSGELCVTVLRNYLKKKGFRDLGEPKEVYGYFKELKEEEDRVESFQRGLRELLNATIRLAKQKHQEGFKIYFNPTGGFKAHVIMLGLASTLTGFPFYYIHEEFRDVIEFYPLFLKLTEEEKALIKLLYETKRISRSDKPDLLKEYENIIEQLANLGIVEIKKDDSILVEVKITPLGETIFETTFKNS
jgi:putative CRISPR-associated protein (TIGR02619 family)